MKTAGIVVAIIVLAVLAYVTGYTKGVIDAEKPQTVKEQVMDLQRRVGAVPDGIIGSETMTKVNEAVKAEEREIFNGYAEVYMTPSGLPDWSKK